MPGHMIVHSAILIYMFRAIWEFAQSQDSENAQRNLEIAQILRLRGTYTLIYIPCK